jgi:hypothetical protein
LPASADATSDDLQDLLALHLQQCKDAGGEVFAFGVRFDRNMHKPIDVEFGNTDGLHGVHDVHLNQGNTGAHAADNHALHDGGLLLRHPDRCVGLFLAFQTQRVPTDTSGAPIPQSQAIADLIHGAPPPALSAGMVYLERALLNPSGDDAGNEVVVLGNLATAAASLQGWQLRDNNQRTTALGPITIPPGASMLVQLDGTGVQLSNKGGSLVLLDPAGHQVDAVVYAGVDAINNQFVRFRR